MGLLKIRKLQDPMALQEKALRGEIMRSIFAGMTIILLLSLSACYRFAGAPQSPLLGEYDLVGRDTSGQVVFTGVISLVSIDQNHVKGHCTIARKQNAPEGLLDQNGNCEALLEGNKVSLDLAPFLDDGGMLLEGEFDQRARITGDWMFDTFSGSKPLGKFEAVKKSG